MFRDAASAPSQSCPTPYNGNCTTCPSAPAPQRTPTTWLGSSRDPNSTVPQSSTPLLASSREISELILGPTDPVARVGTYVVMVAGIKDRGGNYRKNKQVEWIIDRSSPGGFIDVDRRDWCDIFVGEWDPPRIESPHHAYTSTSRKPLRLTKGTKTPLDDVVIHEGQTWTAISSPCEGTTKLTAIALDSSDWQNRLRAANIHWIDAWPVLPPAKIAQNFSQTLNLQSAVYRANGSPAIGCIAVYEIIRGGEDVEFKTSSENSGSNSISQIIIPVGCNGLAEAQLVKKTPSAGQTVIRTTLIRDNSDGRFTVPIRLAQGETVIDWGEAGLLVSRSGPAIVSQGMETAYRITVRNVNSEQLSDIVVTDTVPESFEYQRSVPVGRVLDALVTNADGSRSQKIQWTIPSLDSGQSQTFDVIYRAQREGDFNLVSTAQSGSVQAEDVLKTRVISSGEYNLPQTPAPTSTPSPLPAQETAADVDLDIQIVNQDTAQVGNNVVIQINVKNNGSETVTNVLSSVSFSQGLCSSFGASPIHLQPIEPIEPGQSRSVSLPFTANAPGRQMISLELIAQNGQRFNRQAFITIEGSPTQNDNCVYPTNPNGTPDPYADNSTPGSGASLPANDEIDINSILFNTTAPAEVKSGEEFQIVIEMENHSDRDLNNLRLTCFLDNNFDIVKFTDDLVIDNPYKPYWNIQKPIPAKSKTRFVLVLKGKSAMPTVCNFVLQQGNLDLNKKGCQILVTESNNADLVPEPISPPDIVDSPDSLAPIPDVDAPEPDISLPPDSDLPSIEDSSLEPPAIEEPAPEVLDEPSADLPNFDAPVPEINESNNIINVDITTKRTKIATNQTFTCQISVKNNSDVPMNAIELSFYFPIDSFKLVKLGTTGKTQYEYNALGGFITFKPYAVLEPGQTLDYNIRLLPQKNGLTELTAAVTAKQSGTEDVRQDAKITVNVE